MCCVLHVLPSEFDIRLGYWRMGDVELRKTHHIGEVMPPTQDVKCEMIMDVNDMSSGY